MEKELLARAKELLERGKQHSKSISRSDNYGANYWYSEDKIPVVRSWFDSVFNLFRLITTPDMHYYNQVIETQNDASNKGDSLELIIDNLTKANAWTSIKAKRIKAYAAIRNKALHAEWDEIELRDVGELIRGVRELLEYDLV
jgi:hypothetical protein